jgi:hypothetical protein
MVLRLCKGGLAAVQGGEAQVEVKVEVEVEELVDPSFVPSSFVTQATSRKWRR